MKKIFTLFAGLLMAAAVFAADRRPTVTINNDYRNYKIVIDGRTIFGDNLNIRLDNSRHTIKVYEMRRGFFVRERLVDAQSFRMRDRDIKINVDRFGQIQVFEKRDHGRYNDDYGRRNDDYGRRNDEYGQRNDDYGRRNDDGYGRRDNGGMYGNRQLSTPGFGGQQLNAQQVQKQVADDGWDLLKDDGQ
jgi:hypothetical protein